MLQTCYARHGDSGNIGAVKKSITFNAGHACGNGNRGETSAVAEGTANDVSHSFRYNKILNGFITVRKQPRHTTINAGHGDGCNVGTAQKGIIADAGHTCGNGNRGETSAAFERVTLNAGDAVKNYDGDKVRTPVATMNAACAFGNRKILDFTAVENAQT